MTSVARRNSSGVVSRTGAKTVAIALFTQTSSGPKRSSIREAASSTRVSVRDVERKGERFAAELLDLPCCGLQPLLATSDEPDAGPVARETTSCSATNPSGRARDRDHVHSHSEVPVVEK